MRKILILLFLVLFFSFNFASLITVVEVTINSVQAPGLCGYLDSSNVGYQARVSSAYLQIGSFNNPVARSRNALGISAGGKTHIAYYGNPGGLFLAAPVSGPSSGGYGITCIESSGLSYKLSVSCAVPNSSTWYAPCTGRSFYTESIVTYPNCSIIQGQDLIPGYCFSLNMGGGSISQVPYNIMYSTSVQSRSSCDNVFLGGCVEYNVNKSNTFLNCDLVVDGVCVDYSVTSDQTLLDCDLVVDGVCVDFSYTLKNQSLFCDLVVDGVCVDFNINIDKRDECEACSFCDDSNFLSSRDEWSCTQSLCESLGKCSYNYDFQNNKYVCVPKPEFCDPGFNEDGECGVERNECFVGTVGNLDQNNTHFTWECHGVGDGQTDYCSLLIENGCVDDCDEDGECGNRATIYPSEQNNWPSGSVYCESGQPSESPSFPQQGESVDWQCLGINGGSDSDVCTAFRNDSSTNGEDPNDIFNGYYNSIVDFKGRYLGGSLEITALCLVDTTGDFLITNILEDPLEIDCNSSEIITRIEGIEFQKDMIEMTLEISEPCVVCKRTAYVNIFGESQEVSISDNNFVLLILILLSIVFIVKKK